MVNELTTSREESGARSDYPEARTDGAARGEPNVFELSRVVTEVDKRSRKKTIVNRRSSEYNAKLFGFAELGRDSTMSESKL